MKTPISRRATAKKHFSSMGLLGMILAFMLAACADREAGEMGSTSEIATEEELNGTAGTEAAPMMPVSVMGPGTVMPTLPAGRATFTVDNTSTEACIFTLIPQTSGTSMMGQGAADRGTAFDATRGTAGDAVTDDSRNAQAGRADMAGTDTTATGNPATGAPGGTAGQGTMQNQQNTRVAARQTSTVTVELQPGMYEVSCISEGTANQQAPNERADALPGMRMLVMVTDAGTGTMGPGMNRPQGGGQGTGNSPDGTPGTSDGTDADGTNR